MEHQKSYNPLEITCKKNEILVFVISLTKQQEVFSI